MASIRHEGITDTDWIVVDQAGTVELRWTKRDPWGDVIERFTLAGTVGRIAAKDVPPTARGSWLAVPLRMAEQAYPEWNGAPVFDTRAQAVRWLATGDEYATNTITTA